MYTIFGPKAHNMCTFVHNICNTYKLGARSCKSELQLKVTCRKIIWAGRPTGQKPAQILSHKSLVHDLGLVVISPASCLLLIRTAWCRRLSNSVDKDALCCQFFFCLAEIPSVSYCLELPSQSPLSSWPEKKKESMKQNEKALKIHIGMAGKS